MNAPHNVEFLELATGVLAALLGVVPVPAAADEHRPQGVVAPLGAFALALGNDTGRQGEDRRTDRHVERFQGLRAD